MCGWLYQMTFVMTQKVINEKIFAVAARPFGPPVQCDKCAAPELHKTFSFEKQHGRLYVHEFSKPGFDPSAAMKLCGACWPTWLMWRAREGWDLHFHLIDGRCERDCLARQGGRKLQFQSQMNLFRNTADQLFLAKSFDGQPTKNGSPLLMSCRLQYFLFRSFTKQEYYESIGDVDELIRQILLNAQLNQIGIPHGATDSFLLIFKVFEGAHHAPGGVITEPKQGEKTLGLHCVHQTGYRDSGETLTFANNWGRSWGKKGFGSVSVDYLRRHFYEAFVLRPAQFGLMPWKLQNVAPKSLSNRSTLR